MSAQMICLSNIFGLAGTLKCAIRDPSVFCWQNGWIHKTRKSNRRNWLRRMTSTLDESRKKKIRRKWFNTQYWKLSLNLMLYGEKKKLRSLFSAADVVRVLFLFSIFVHCFGARSISSIHLCRWKNLFMSFFFLLYHRHQASYTMFKHLGESRDCRQLNMAVGIAFRAHKYLSRTNWLVQREQSRNVLEKRTERKWKLRKSITFW